MKRFLAVLFLPLGLWAYTLGDLVSAAGKGDLALAGEWRVQAAAAAHSAAKRSYLPAVDVGARFSEVDEVSMEPQTALTATLSWTIFDGFAREYEIGARRHEKTAALLEQKDTLNKNALQTVQLYFGLLSAREAVRAQTVKVRQLAAERERLAGFERAGIASASQSAQIEAALEGARYELASLEVEVMNLRLMLSDLTGLDLTQYEPAPVSLMVPQGAEQTAQRPDIEAQKARIHAQKNRAEAVRSAYLPNIALENTYSKNRYNDALPLDMPEDQNRLSLTLSMRLVDFGRIRSEREAALLHKRAEESRLAYVIKNATSQQRLAGYRLQSAQKKVESAAKALESSEIVLDQAQKKFQSRLIDEIYYLDALGERTLSYARLAAAVSDYEIAKAEYYYAHGTPIEEKIQ